MERRVSLEGTCLFSSYVENVGRMGQHVRLFSSKRPDVFMETRACFYQDERSFWGHCTGCLTKKKPDSVSQRNQAYVC